MKTKSFIAGMLLIATLPVRAATNDLTSALQKGLFEEEANHNLDAAAQAYQTVSAQFDKDRKLAATAIFRLGEVYRKQGKTNDATAQYERIVREFSDQSTLVTLSRQNLAGLGEKKETLLSSPLTRAARLEQKKLLEDEIKLVEQDLAELKKRLEAGVAPQTEVRAKEREVLKLRQQVAALNVDAEDVAAGTSASAPVTDDEEKEIRRIQEMIKNSPDLINAPQREEGTSLFQAATKGQLQVAGFLLGHGAEVNAIAGSHGKMWDNWTPLMAGANGGHKAMVELLLNRGANVDAKALTGQTALLLAAKNGFGGVAESLLAHKANVNVGDNTESTPLHIAAAMGHSAMTELLLRNGANVNTADNQGQTPLMQVSSSGRLALAKILLAAKADVNLQSSSGRTALSHAAGGNLDIVKALLQAKADPNEGKLDLPLVLAARWKQLEIANLLLGARAKPDLASKTSWSIPPPGQPGQPGHGGDTFGPYTPLQAAVAQGDAAMVKLLFKFNADPNAKDPWYTSQQLIFYAVANAEMLKAFLDAGADPNVGTVSGITPLIQAVQWDNLDAVTLLLAKGVDKEMRMNGVYSALRIAVDRGQEKIASELLQAGADANTKSESDGRTALHQAVEWRDLAMTKLLLEHQADPNIRDASGQTPLDLAKRNRAAVMQSRALATSVRSRPQTNPTEIAALLRKHGALDDLPRVDRIEVRRPSANFSISVFLKGTNDWNQFSLLELIACHYGLISDRRSGDISPQTAKAAAIWRGDALRFPDIKKLVIHRPAADGRSWTTIPVNVADILSSGDCSRDVALRWGDVVEIPEADHPVTENWPGLSDPDRMALIKCVSRTVRVAINRTNALLKLSPVFQRAEPNAPIFLEDGSFLGVGHAKLSTVSFLLRSVLDHSKLVRFSSDLTRVRVAHLDPATGQTRDLVLDCSNPALAPDLWLRDGDVIEVPDKP